MLANLPEQFWIIFTSIQSSGLNGVLQGERHDLFITRKCLISQTTCVVTLSATFYTPTSKFPIPRTADQIIPLSNLSPTQANVFSIDESGLGGVSMVTLPPQTKEIYVEIYASGNSLEEFWYTSECFCLNQGRAA